MAILRAPEHGVSYRHTEALFIENCASCGILFGYPESFRRRRQADGRALYCPNGHTLSYHETDEDRERARREKAEAALESARRRAANAEEAAAIQRRRAEHQERRARALKGHLTRMRNRIANGVCPVPGCHRSGFVKVRAHLASKHADWLAEHVHELEGS